MAPSTDPAIERARAEELTAYARERGVTAVNLQFCDILGVVKSVTIPLGLLVEATEHGKWFDGSSIDGFARMAESDMYLQPDLTTFAIVPWTKAGDGRARVFCWVRTPNGDPAPGDPRAVLARALARIEADGLTYQIGPELEFFLFQRGQNGLRPLADDRAGYFDYSTDVAAQIRHEMVSSLQAMSIAVETDHHEVAAGQHEIDFTYAGALQAADNIVTLKYTLKAIAQRHNLHATFMPKPLFGVNGNGMHCHQSLADRAGRNVFSDPTDEYGLSSFAKAFIAGQLAHARGMCAVVAPLVNSYKRLVAGYEAPVYISWGRVNRSALIRVPRISPGQDRATRLELRCPDPCCNPYLALAVMLNAGMDGVRRNLPLPEPVEENIYRFDEAELRRRNIGLLPGTLGEALDALRDDPVVQEALGEHILERFMAAKRQEWDAFRAQVTPWEHEQYLELY